MQIDMDFIEDIRLVLSAELRQLGYDLPELTGHARDDAHRVCVDRWNAHARRIPARPRSVHWSRELRDREPMLSAEIRSGLAVVEREITSGDDLTARLSRRLGKRKFNDLMLNDWGIQHVHLDAVNRADGTDETLFVLVRADDAYLTDVRLHGAWADGDLVEIIHANWPTEIERFRSNAVGLTHPLTDEQRRTLRSKHANSAIQMKDGTVYQAMGGGYASSGANIKAVMWGDYMLDTAKLVEDFLRGQAAWLAGIVGSETGTRPDRATLHLRHLARDHALVLLENTRQPFVFRVPIEQPPRVVVDFTAPATFR